MNRLPFQALGELEQARGSAVVVYCTNDQSPKNLNGTDLRVFAHRLERFEGLARLDLVLHCEGGIVSSAREFALQLRDRASHVGVFVARKAHSAATLMCLSADELVLGPAAELSPIDPQIRSGAEASSNLPKRISSEEVRGYLEMSKDWFGLESEAGRLQVFTLLSQRILPTTLGAFYRADRYVRKVADELLERSFPGSAAERAKVVEQLISGYPDHQYRIRQYEALRLGLKARATSDIEGRLLRQIVRGCQEFMNSPVSGGGLVRALFFSRRFGVQFVARDADSEGDEESDGQPASMGAWREIGTM